MVPPAHRRPETREEAIALLPAGIAMPVRWNTPPLSVRPTPSAWATTCWGLPKVSLPEPIGFLPQCGSGGFYVSRRIAQLFRSGGPSRARRAAPFLSKMEFSSISDRKALNYLLRSPRRLPKTISVSHAWCFAVRSARRRSLRRSLSTFSSRSTSAHAGRWG